MSDASISSLKDFYDSLWQQAEEAFLRQTLTLDPHLNHKSDDQRRGLSLILRPGNQTIHEINLLLTELRSLETDPYYYSELDYHVTVMSLITVSAQYDGSRHRLESYQAVLAQALTGLDEFSIRFHGITATPEAVMIQGFPEQNALNQLRHRIQKEMISRGLPLQQRYSPQTAHVTVLRYHQPCKNLSAWAEKLRNLRFRDFGVTQVKAIHLVENDWYMSADKLKLVETYPVKMPI